MPEIEKGRVKADRQNERSTKNVINEKKAAEKSITESRENEFHMKTVDLTNKLHSYKIGRFTSTSSKGHKHVMIVCDHDSNAMLYRPLKTKSALEQMRNI